MLDRHPRGCFHVPEKNKPAEAKSAPGDASLPAIRIEKAGWGTASPDAKQPVVVIAVKRPDLFRKLR